MPTNLDNDAAFPLLQELFQLATLLVERRKATKDEEWNFGPALAFAGTAATIHGKSIDDYARLILRGRDNNGKTDESNDERAHQLGTSLESLILASIEGVQELLGIKWNNPQRQGNGQPAFESKSEPVDHGSSHVSNTALAPMLQVLQTCAEHCPIFLVHLPTSRDQDRNEDLLILRAIESAVSSILEPDVATATSGMSFLEALHRVEAEHPDAQSGSLHPLKEVLMRVRQESLNRIMIGVCGKFGTSSVLDVAATLLHRLLRTYAFNVDECRTTLLGLAALSNTEDHFWLGAIGRSIVLDCLFKCCQNQMSPEQLRSLTEAIWDLHHCDTLEALSDSDAVSRFCQRFTGV